MRAVSLGVSKARHNSQGRVIHLIHHTACACEGVHRAGAVLKRADPDAAIGARGEPIQKDRVWSPGTPAGSWVLSEVRDSMADKTEDGTSFSELSSSASR